MDVSRYFYQQLSGRFFRIAFLSLFLCTSLTALLVLRDNQVTLLAGEKLPFLTKQNIQQQQILSTYLALDDLAKRTHAENLADDYQHVQRQINKISLPINKNKSQLERMYIGHKEFAGVIAKLDKNHDRNYQLKQNTIIQLQLINDQLSSDIKEKNRQTSLLLKQISVDRFTDKVTANRTKAYAVQLTELSQSQKLQQIIIRALLAFQQLDLQSPILEFDDVSAELKQAVTNFLPAGRLVSRPTSLLTTQLITLDQLLFSQQNSVAKWRSHLRLSRLYVEFIKQQQQKLQQLVLEISSVKPSPQNNKLFLIDWVPAEIKDLFDQQNITLNNQNLQLSILGFIGLLFLLLLRMIFAVKKKVKSYGQESEQLFTQFIESRNKNSDEKCTSDMFNSKENKRIAEQFQKSFEIMTNPVHSEKQYQQKIEEQKTTNQHINQQLEEIKKLKSCIEFLESVSSEESLMRKSQDRKNNEKLSNMVVRTMLQSQSVSIGSGVTSLQVYRQLARIFDWCRQNRIRNDFSSAMQSKTLNDVALHREIDAALLNIITDAHFQRNNIYYQQDEKLLTHAKLDIRLFHRLFSGICRLLLADLFKANLQINTVVLDKNEGQQIIRFNFSVKASKKIAQVPKEIERLLLVERPKSAKIISNDTLDYMCLLFDSLHVTDKNVQLQDNGYQFSFTLPIAFVETAAEITSNKVDLKQTNILLLSQDNSIRDTIEKSISSANGLIESFANPELVVQQLSATHLAAKKIDLVILGSDFYSKSLENIQQHISNLDKNIQPKLFVIQPFFNASLEKFGLFQQTANPLKIIELQQSLSDCLSNNKKSNSKLDANTFAEHQFLVTQVEVLFAVASPTEHLTLIRILQWLGLQVKIVCQPKAMIKFWTSGRYLLLFTEFDQSPFIEIAAGKGVRRDIFTFTQRKFSTSGDQSLAKKWGEFVVPELKNIDALVALLQPWLKRNETKVISIDKSEKFSNDVHVSKRSEVNTLNTNEPLDNLSPTLALPLPETSKNNQADAINLVLYAQNQGSAELAVVMLDDYLDDIDETVKKLSVALAKKNHPLGISLTHALIKTGTILAAVDFTDICQQLLVNLNKGVTTEHKQAMVLFSELSHQKLLLNQFAEAI
ncbi:MAG: hypothetical protein HRT54_06250 [Colwellia sp.]|nr:hypothetical protein [Colwellia sp.]